MLDFRTYDTTAARIAVTLTSADIGRVEAFDRETGKVYKAVAAGTGANCWIPFAEQFCYIEVSLNDFREVDANSDVGAIAANGGILASDTTPIMRGDAAESQEIVWAASNNDPIVAHKTLPPDFDGSRDVTVLLRTASGGTTNAASFTVETGWDGGALVSDTATGTAATATGAANATVAAADIADTAYSLTLVLTPVAHTTDTTALKSCWIRAYRK